MEQTECSEMSAYKIQTPGNYPEENIQHTEQQKFEIKIYNLCLKLVIYWLAIYSHSLYLSQRDQ